MPRVALVFSCLMHHGPFCVTRHTFFPLQVLICQDCGVGDCCDRCVGHGCVGMVVLVMVVLVIVVLVMVVLVMVVSVMVVLVMVVLVMIVLVVDVLVMVVVTKSMTFCFALLLCHYAGFFKGPLSHLPASDIQRLQQTKNQTRRWALTTQHVFLYGRLDNTGNEWHSDAAAIH